MEGRLLVFYGSYREPRFGIRMAKFVVSRLQRRGLDVELIDAREVGLPILSRMYKEYPPGAAPTAMEELARKIKTAAGFIFICGEYNWGIQPGLKNLTDHFLEEWFWRPAAIASYSAQRTAAAHASDSWHNILSEMGMIVISSTIYAAPVAQVLDEQGEPQGDAGKNLEARFPRFADDLIWWVEAAEAQRLRSKPPY